MTVNAGIDREQKDIYGLAHFCEHMLFLGSKKYPNSTHFVDYITQFGGKFNGYTDFDTTGFFFKIHTDRFVNAFEIFSRFFIDPLLSEEYVDKEVNSVNSEFERNIQLDAKRKEMILRNIANPDSLFHRFSTGNKITLSEYAKKNKINLREKVFEFYTKNYRPDNMKLIVYGNKDLEFYRDFIIEKFKEMKKPDSPMEELQYKKLPWEYLKLGKLVLYETINNHQELDINFMIEDIHENLPDNSSAYFSTLLNYKGKGSLDDILRKNGLIAGIKASVRKTHKGFSLFKLKGYCTTRGIKNLDKVISIIFKYIKFIKKRAINKKLYDYTKKIFDIAFFYNSKKKQLAKILKMFCGVVWKYNPKYWLSQHIILNEYNESNLIKFADKLVLKNAIVMLGNKTFKQMTENYNTFIQDFNKEEISLNETDPFYHTKYIQKNFKLEFINELDEADPINNIKGNKLKLFANSKSLPNKINLVKECKSGEKKNVRKK
jgi:insulysin